MYEYIVGKVCVKPCNFKKVPQALANSYGIINCCK